MFKANYKTTNNACVFCMWIMPETLHPYVIAKKKKCQFKSLHELILTFLKPEHLCGPFWLVFIYFLSNNFFLFQKYHVQHEDISS